MLAPAAHFLKNMRQEFMFMNSSSHVGFCSMAVSSVPVLVRPDIMLGECTKVHFIGIADE